MAFGVIYKAIHRLGGMVYVGQTRICPVKRLQQHARKTRSKSHFDHAVRMHGVEAFELTVIDSAETFEELLVKEQEWIQRLNCLHPRGYNLSRGGEGGGNTGDYRLGAKTRAKMSLAQSNRSHEHRQNLGKSLTGHPVSEGTRALISQKLKGKPLPVHAIEKRIGVPRCESTKEKIAEFQRGRRKSAETRQRMSIAQRALGKTISEEQRRHLRELNLGKKQSFETRLKRSIALKAAWEKRRAQAVR